MQLQEVVDAAPTIVRDLVESRRNDIHDVPGGRHLFRDELGGQLGQHDRRGFERLEESGREPDRHAIVLPERLAMARSKADLASVPFLVPRADVAPQRCARRLFGRVVARVDVADSPTCRQADVPDPTGFLCRGDRVGGHRSVRRVVRDLNGEGRVAEQDVAAVLEAHPERLAQQEGREPGAIDEQIPRNRAGLPGDDRLDVAAFVLVHARHVCQHVANPEFGRAVLLQERRELACVQMVGVVGDRLIFRSRDQFRRQPQIAELALGADIVAEGGGVVTRVEPMGHQVDLGESLGKHQGVVVPVVVRARRPAIEARALFEGGIAMTEELRLGHTHLLECRAQRRPGSLADADDVDGRRFDQRDREGARLDAALVARGDDPGSQPPGGPAANDDDGPQVPDWFSVCHDHRDRPYQNFACTPSVNVRPVSTTSRICSLNRPWVLKTLLVRFRPSK